MANLQVALHLSSTAVYTVLGYAVGTPDNPKVKIVSVGLAHTDAFAGGKIDHREHLLSAIHKSLQEASNMAGVQIHDVCLSFASTLMIAKNETQAVLLNTDGEHSAVRYSDLYHAKELINHKWRAEGYAPLQSCQLIAYLDGIKQEISNPVGMHASTIEVVNHVMALPVSYHTQVVDVVRSSGEIGIGATLFDGVVSAEYALTAEEKKQAVCFIDIGHGTTKVCIYMSNKLIFSDCLDVGGHMVTLDISAELGLSISESNSLKHQYGTLMLDPSKRATFITLKRRTGGEVTISLRRLSEIITARYVSIFDLINQRLMTDGLLDLMSSGVVLAGGGCQIDGLVSFIARSWGVPVRMMTVNPNVSICPENLTDDNIVLLNSYLKDNKLHSAIGSLLYQNSEQFYKDHYGEVQTESQLARKVLGRWQAFVKRLTDFF